MSRRAISPLRTRTEGDPRDNMIRKLKEDLIVARGKEKQMAILDQYLFEAREKGRLLEAEKVKSEEQGRIKLEMTQRTINELKKQLQVLRGQIRAITLQTRQVEQQGSEISKNLNSKAVQIQKLKKEGLVLHADNQKLVNQLYRIKAIQEETNHQIRKLAEGVRDFELRSSQINNKLIEVKAYINELTDINNELRDKLRGYENKNDGLGDQIDVKEETIDNLERAFSQKHQTIKNQVQVYIELEHKNDKCQKETKHNLNLIRIENEKAAELNAAIKRVEKHISEQNRELALVREESNEIHAVNKQYIAKNGQMKKDLSGCQDHLENLVRHNAIIQEEMENILREDQAIISIIRRKRVIQAPNHYASIRSSRAEARLSNRTYH